jgi:hypothetical protein
MLPRSALCTASVGLHFSPLSWTRQLELPCLPDLLFTVPLLEEEKTPTQSSDLSREGTLIKEDEEKARVAGSLEQEAARTRDDDELEPGEI